MTQALRAGTHGHPSNSRLEHARRGDSWRVLASADTGWDAQQAIRALHENGFADIGRFNVRQALRAIKATQPKEYPPRRAWERLWPELSDESDDRRTSLGALRQERSMVMVFAPRWEDVDQATGILKTHALRYFER